MDLNEDDFNAAYDMIWILFELYKFITKKKKNFIIIFIKIKMDFLYIYPFKF